MKCKLGDRVRVIRSDVGNVGKCGIIGGVSLPGVALVGRGNICGPDDDWIVIGEFNIIAGGESERQVVRATSFRDDALEPIPDDEPAETIGARRAVEA